MNFALYVIYTILLRSPGLDNNAHNIKTNAINITLFIVMVNCFTLFVGVFHVGTLLFAYDYHPWFLLVGITYLFTMRYFVLRRLTGNFFAIIHKFSAHSYSRMFISFIAVLFFTCTLLCFMACSLLVLAFR